MAWHDTMKAYDAVVAAFGSIIADKVVSDLGQNNPFLTVSWVNPTLDDHSEIGGVGSLGWHIPDGTLLTIFYEAEVTPQNRIDQAMQWLLENENR